MNRTQSRPSMMACILCCASIVLMSWVLADIVVNAVARIHPFHVSAENQLRILFIASGIIGFLDQKVQGKSLRLLLVYMPAGAGWLFFVWWIVTQGAHYSNLPVQIDHSAAYIFFTSISAVMFFACGWRLCGKELRRDWAIRI